MTSKIRRRSSTRLVITKNCGNCHEESLKTYTETYHGQVNKLGYAYTAKCFDCHGSHAIQRVDDPQSTVYPANRLKTCQQCHQGATQGFVTFEPHGNTHDFARYPADVARVEVHDRCCLAGTFAFFWAHTALWFYREYKDRQERKTPAACAYRGAEGSEGQVFPPLPAGCGGSHT